MTGLGSQMRVSCGRLFRCPTMLISMPKGTCLEGLVMRNRGQRSSLPAEQ